MSRREGYKRILENHMEVKNYMTKALEETGAVLLLALLVDIQDSVMQDMHVYRYTHMGILVTADHALPGWTDPRLHACAAHRQVQDPFQR